MCSFSDERIYELISLFYETAGDVSPEGWQTVYKTASELLSSKAGGLSLYFHNKNRFDQLAGGFSRDSITRYNDLYQHVNPFHKKIVKMNIGERFSRSLEIDDAEFVKTDFYREYCKKQSIYNLEYQVLFNNGEISVGISFARPEKMKNFGENEIKVMRLINSHLQRAIQLQMRIVETERDRRIMRECFGKISQGVVVLNKHGKAVFFNESAGKIIAAGDGLQIGRGEILKTNLALETKKLQLLVQGIFEPDNNPGRDFGGILQISRASGVRPLTLFAVPFSEQNTSGFGSEKFVLLFVNDPEQKIENAEPVLREMYKLTAAEAKIAVALAHGNSISEACGLLEITENTIRTHLKRIFSKTETARQSELIKLILNSPANININNINSG